MTLSVLAVVSNPADVTPSNDVAVPVPIVENVAVVALIDPAK